MIASRLLVLALASAPLACGTPAPADRPLAPPATLDEFRAAATRLIERAGVPGAGIALVRADGVEWAGGIGLADREGGSPVTAETHFRVGSISKTFVAAALVQQYEDGALDLDTPVAEIVPEVAIDNPFSGSPVTVLHLLQHTAGFDDMHFNETYNLDDPPDLPLVEVLRRNPASRTVRWRPGTRMSYANPGYTVAAAVLERVTGRPYEDVIRERIFAPVGMPTSSFTLTEDDRALLARGYDTPEGPAVPLTPVYHRPAWNLHSSAAELGRFVQMLLNWGETADTLVIDPEYLSNMERPRSSLAASAGLIYGYGSGIISGSLAGFPVLGHHGGIEGFASAYGYSAARDVGWVVLVNAAHAPEVVEALAALAVAYLKHDVEPPTPAAFAAAPTALEAHAGYYHPSGARRTLVEPVSWLFGGVTIRADGAALVASPITARARRLVPVSDTVFRWQEDVTPSRVFLDTEDGAHVLAGDDVWAPRRARWPIELVRVPVLASVAAVATWPVALLIWLVRGSGPKTPGLWSLRLALGLPLVALAAMFGLLLAPPRDWGSANAWTRAVFLGTWALPLGAITATARLAQTWGRAHRWLTAYATALAIAAAVLSMYLVWWGLLGIRLWRT